MSDRAPAYRDHVLHFDALRLVALREGGSTEETSATRFAGDRGITRRGGGLRGKEDGFLRHRSMGDLGGICIQGGARLSLLPKQP